MRKAPGMRLKISHNVINKFFINGLKIFLQMQRSTRYYSGNATNREASTTSQSEWRVRKKKVSVYSDQVIFF